ncbi:MAG: hypothetical protein ACYS9X_17235 [Planctomycetota bacterium]|jgi:hypothetical protein
MAKKGTVWGAVVGFLAGGPVGAVVGGMIGGKVQSELEAQAEQRRERHALALADMRSVIAAVIADESGSDQTVARPPGKDSPGRRNEKESHAIAQAKFTQSYVQETPDLLEILEGAAELAGLAPQVLPILNAAEGYFLEKRGEAGDGQDLASLLEYAYFARSLVAEVNEGIRLARGSSLLDVDLASANRIAGHILAKDVRDRLDSRVRETINGPDLRQSMPALLEAGAAVLKTAGPLLALAAALQGQSSVPSEPTQAECMAAGMGIDLNSPY